jgi:DNA-binding IscR family transcriptional regulator
MEGPVAPMDCVSENLADQTCPLIPGCQTRPVWVKVRDSIIDAIDSITLADLLNGPVAGQAGLMTAEAVEAKAS